MANNEKQMDSQKLIGIVVKSKDLVDFHEDSIVSRTLIDKTTGTCTIFAFSEGQGLSEHTAPFDTLVYILDGATEVTVYGKSTRLEEGEMIIIPANEPHALRALAKFKMMLVMIKS